MPLFLSAPFDQLWKDKDPFQEAFSLTGTVYRELESRRTLRFEVNGRGYFVKLHYGLGWWSIICELVRFRAPIASAQTEYEALALLEKIGVNSMQPVAFGIQSNNPAHQQSFLITRELSQTISLEDFCKDWATNPPAPQLKRALISEVASMVRKMHAAGMNHRDCYLVHFLLHTNTLCAPKISLIDLHRAQIRQNLPSRWRNKDLAALAYSAANIGLGFKDYCRFLKTYFQKPLHEICRKEKPLLDFLRSETNRLTKRWDKKFSEAALEQQARKQGAWINPDYVATLAKQGITLANAFDHFWNLRLTAADAPNTGRGGVSEVCQAHIDSKAVYIKRQTMHLRYSINAPLGEPTFTHEFRSLQEARGLGAPGPKVIFFGQKNLPGKPKSAILITESLEPTHRSLADILTQWQTIPKTRRLEIMRAIGKVIANLHSANFTHNCLYPKHIFIAKAPIEAVEITLIDFEKLRPAWLAYNKKQDLDRLYRHLPKRSEQETGVDASEWQALLAAYRTKPERTVFLLPQHRTLRLAQTHRLLPKKRITAKAFINNEANPVLAKVFLGGDAHAKARAEVAGLALLKTAGIACPDLLSCHDLKTDGTVVLTQYLINSETLADRLGKDLNIMAKTHAQPSTDQVLAWLTQAIRAVGRLHRAGLIHNDLHFANLLFQGDTLYVLDGDAIQRTKSAALTLTNLAAFFGQLPPSMDQFQGQLLQEYAQEHPDTEVSKNPATQKQLTIEIQKIRKWRCEDVLSKAVRDCTLFSVSKTFTKFTACARDNADWLAPLLQNPDAFMKADIIKRGNTCTVARATLNGHKLIIKRYNIKGVWHWLTRFWRPSRAWHSWLAAHRLRFWEISTPEPIALIEERLGPFRKRAWFISEEIYGPNMAEHMASHAGGEIPDSEKQSLRSLFDQLIQHRITHGDMKATNFIWANSHWAVIDLDSVMAHETEKGFQKAWAKDQTRFNANWGSGTKLRA